MKPLNSPTIRLLNMKIHPLCLCMLAALLCSCASTSVKQTWKSPDFQQPVGKVAVVAIERRGLVRQGFENRFVAQLAKHGSTAMVTFDQLSLDEIKQDRRAAADRFQSNGADVVLILRLVDTATFYRESQPGGERYAGAVTGVTPMGWYDYYSVGFMNMSPTYGTLKQTVYLEAVLYDLKSERRLWSGLTRTVVSENMDRVAEMDPLVEKIVASMRKDGVF